MNKIYCHGSCVHVVVIHCHGIALKCGPINVFHHPVIGQAVSTHTHTHTVTISRMPYTTAGQLRDGDKEEEFIRCAFNR